MSFRTTRVIDEVRWTGSEREKRRQRSEKKLRGNCIVKFKKGLKGKKGSEEEGWHLEDMGLSRFFTPKVVKPFLRTLVQIRDVAEKLKNGVLPAQSKEVDMCRKYRQESFSSQSIRWIRVSQGQGQPYTSVTKEKSSRVHTGGSCHNFS